MGPGQERIVTLRFDLFRPALIVRHEHPFNTVDKKNALMYTYTTRTDNFKRYFGNLKSSKSL